MLDAYQTDISAQKPESLETWNDAMASYLGFRGNPVQMLQEIEDDAFLAGPAFCAAMRLLGGADPASEPIKTGLAAIGRAAESVDEAERGHAVAVFEMAKGEFSAAARCWDKVLEQRPGDVLAHKCAHETWFLIGDIKSMRASTTAALERLDPDHPAYSVAAGQHGFALEESGDYAGAEAWARLSLDMAPTDCWALHCLAHIYESQNRHADAMALLNSRMAIWREQNLLDAHIWWHLALRHVETRDFNAALGVFDEYLADVPASNRFRLTDGTSLLWRLELDGVDVGNRWRGMAEKWAESATVHTNAFLDLHAAMAFARCPDMPAADMFFDTLFAAFEDDTSENAEIFERVTKPLALAVRRYADAPKESAPAIAAVFPGLQRIGGSAVQRELFERSYSSALIAGGEGAAAADWLDPKIEHHPNTPWLLRARADAAQLMGETAQATLLQRRANLMFAGWV